MADNENSEITLEDQLHQQFAENDNNRSSVFVSFITGIIALFGFYGFVFVNTNKPKYWNFDIQEFLLMSFVTIGILFFLAILALYLGYSLRRDHFIVHNIRRKRYEEKTKEETEIKMQEVFGKIYSPAGKKCCDFLPDFYNLFYWLFFASEIFIFITTILKINEIINAEIPFCICKNMLFIFIILLFHIIFIYLTLKFRKCYYKKYRECARNMPDTQI